MIRSLFLNKNISISKTQSIVKRKYIKTLYKRKYCIKNVDDEEVGYEEGDLDTYEHDSDLFNELEQYNYDDLNEWIEENGKDSVNMDKYQQKMTRKSKERSFQDSIVITAVGGDGGDGLVSFGRGKNKRIAPPDGGDGGDGGNIILKAVEGKINFGKIPRTLKAPNGQKGGKNNRVGKTGKDLIIEVPMGSIVVEMDVEDDDEDEDDPEEVKDFLNHVEMYNKGDLPDEVQDELDYSKPVGFDDLEDPEQEEIDRFNAENDFERDPEQDAIDKFNAENDFERDPEQDEIDRFNAENDFERDPEQDEMDEAELYDDEMEYGADDELDYKEVYSTKNIEDTEVEESLGYDPYEEVDPSYTGYGTWQREIPKKRILADLSTPGQTVVLVKGAAGGRGNRAFKSGRNRSPSNAVKGKKGEKKKLRLELKLIADIGLVGLPNAGKSTFLNAISNQTPKIAHYAFTTLKPNIGTIVYEDTSKLTVADLPGIIEGAHQNRGLGLEFLRHIERTSVLLYIIDMSGESTNPVEDFNTLKEELFLYSRELHDRESIIIANKMDLENSQKNLEEFTDSINFSDYAGTPIIPVSAKYLENKMEQVPDILRSFHKTVKNKRKASLNQDEIFHTVNVTKNKQDIWDAFDESKIDVKKYTKNF